VARELTEQGEDRRDQLLEHAAALFAERGYRATRITDIARAAGVAKGLLYWYFPSKEALLTELAQDVLRGLRELQRTALLATPDPLERIYLGVLVTTRYVAEHNHVYATLMSADGRSAGSSFGRIIAAHARDAARRIAEGQAAGHIRTDEKAITLSFGLSALVNEQVRFHAMGLISGSIDDLARVVARQAVHLLAADRDAATAVLARHRALASRAASARRRVAARQAARLDGANGVSHPGHRPS
jgi:AcrR family transcriptional regulator